DLLRPRPAVSRLRGLATVVGAEGARRRYGDPHSLRIAGIKNDGVQAHAARAGLPLGASAMAAQGGEFLPVLSAVGRAKDGGVFHAGVNRVGVGERRLQMPHALELPGMLRAVVPLMRGERLAGFGRRVVSELIAVALGRARWGGRFSGRRSGLMPGFAAVV